MVERIAPVLLQGIEALSKSKPLTYGIMLTAQVLVDAGLKYREHLLSSSSATLFTTGATQALSEAATNSLTK